MRKTKKWFDSFRGYKMTSGQQKRTFHNEMSFCILGKKGTCVADLCSKCEL